MKHALTVALFSLFAAVPAHSYEVETTTGVICNTSRQVEELIAFNEEQPQAAIQNVNIEERDPTACGQANVEFVRGRTMDTVRTNKATFAVVKILVIGVVTRHGVQPVTPAAYFSLFEINERLV